MPKRKRDSQDQSNIFRASKFRKQDVLEKYTQSKKLLHRALKTAKGFERQKLGKRLKNAKAESKIPDIIRINREIEALKGLDLDKVTEGHLNKSLLRIKAFVESVNLPDEVKVEIQKPEGTEENVAAMRNVVSGMCNMKQVKEVIESAIGGMYIALGIPKPAKGGKQEDMKGILKKDVTAKAALPTSVRRAEHQGDELEEEPAWDGFESDGEPEDIFMEDADDAEDESGSGDEEDEDEDIIYDSLDEEAISRYEALLGGSSDEESFDEAAEYTKNRLSHPQNTTQQSRSPSFSLSDTNPNTTLVSDSDPDSDSILATKAKATSKPKSKKAPPPPRPKGSTFLPTLMGGYWSGTDSSASEIEDLPSHEIRKNRPGQVARRAIWEKKYGTGANHIKSGQGSVADKGKDDGWDAKRGAKDERRRGGRGQVTGDNSKAVGSASRGRGRGSGGVVKKKDDEGVLHPSWQAAKKAKDAEKMAKFAGKKVTFD